MGEYKRRLVSAEPFSRNGVYLIAIALVAGLALVYLLYSLGRSEPARPLPPGVAISPGDALPGMPIASHWRFREGDDSRWSESGYDDSDWQAVDFPHRWSPSADSLPGHSFAWYRKRIQFDIESEAQRDQLALLSVRIGNVLSAYELYAGGILIGGAGSLPPEPQVDYGNEAVFSVPLAALSEQGELLLSLRVWAGSEVIADRWGAGPYGGEFCIGNYRDLHNGLVRQGAPTFLLAVTCIIFGLYHLLLYFRNRGLEDFLWFGLTSVIIGIYCATLSGWRGHLGLDPESFKKLEFIALYLLPPLSLQMTWSMFDERPAPLARLYQLSFVTLAAAWSLVPGIDIHASTLSYWLLWTVPVLYIIGSLVLQRVRQGDAQARTIALGAFLFLATCLVDISAELINSPVPRMLPWGFLALSLGVGNFFGVRFAAMLNHLEREVADRTAELSAANRRLSEIVRIDPLTGLLNRRGFVLEAEREIHRLVRSGRAFSILLADVDHFKAINDHHGHACGDHILAQLAAQMLEEVRDVDSISRWGGEEFILLLPETDSEGAAVLAEKLRDSIERRLYRFDSSELNVTITIGVATIRQGENLEACVARADRALYQGKHGGRNTVRIADV